MGPAIGRDERGDGEDGGIEPEDGDHHPSAGLNQRLPTDAISAISGGECRSPSQATIRGSAHLAGIAQRGVVKLCIIIAAELAAGRTTEHAAGLTVVVNILL